MVFVYGKIAMVFVHVQRTLATWQIEIRECETKNLKNMELNCLDSETCQDRRSTAAEHELVQGVCCFKSTPCVYFTNKSEDLQFLKNFSMSRAKVAVFAQKQTYKNYRGKSGQTLIVLVCF